MKANLLSTEAVETHVNRNMIVSRSPMSTDSAQSGNAAPSRLFKYVNIRIYFPDEITLQVRSIDPPHLLSIYIRVDSTQYTSRNSELYLYIISLNSTSQTWPAGLWIHFTLISFGLNLERGDTRYNPNPGEVREKCI